MNKFCMLLILIMPTAYAGPLLELHGLSKHLNNSSSLNEVNLGLGIGWESEDYSISMGQFKNSFYRTSKYLSTSYQVKNSGFGLDLGFVTGYTKTRWLVLPTFEVLLGRKIWLKSRLVPPIKNKSSGVIQASLLVKF